MEDDNPRRWRQVERATTSFHGRAQMAGSIRGMGVVDFDDYRPTDEEEPAVAVAHEQHPRQAV